MEMYHTGAAYPCLGSSEFFNTNLCLPDSEHHMLNVIEVVKQECASEPDRRPVKTQLAGPTHTVYGMVPKNEQTLRQGLYWSHNDNDWGWKM